MGMCSYWWLYSCKVRSYQVLSSVLYHSTVLLYMRPGSTPDPNVIQTIYAGTIQSHPIASCFGDKVSEATQVIPSPRHPWASSLPPAYWHPGKSISPQTAKKIWQPGRGSYRSGVRQRFLTAAEAIGVAEATRGVTVNLTCPLDWGQGMPEELVKHCFWVCLWRYFQNILAFELANWVKQIGTHTLIVGGHDPTPEGLSGRKGRGRVSPLPAGGRGAHLLLPSDRGPPGSRASSPSPPILRPSHSSSLRRWPSSSPAHRQQIMGLLGLHNRVRQFL